MKRKSQDACGCAMGAAFMLVGMVGSMAVYGAELYQQHIGIKAALLRFLLITVSAAGLGKSIGIARHKLKQRRLASPET